MQSNITTEDLKNALKKYDYIHVSDLDNKIKNVAGVYFIYDCCKEVIYIGMSATVKGRLKAHINNAKNKNAKQNMKNIAQDMEYIKYIPLENASNSILKKYEDYYIQLFKPKYNRLSNDSSINGIDNMFVFFDYSTLLKEVETNITTEKMKKLQDKSFRLARREVYREQYENEIEEILNCVTSIIENLEQLSEIYNKIKNNGSLYCFLNEFDEECLFKAALKDKVQLANIDLIIKNTIKDWEVHQYPISNI